MSHILDPPIFSSTCIHTCLYRGFVLVHEGFCSGGLSGVFLSGRGGFCPSLLLSEYMYIHYNRKLNITFNFRFHMYEIFFKSVTSHALGPLPCHKLSHLLGYPPPSSVTYFMDGPLTPPYLQQESLYIPTRASLYPGICRTWPNAYVQ